MERICAVRKCLVEWGDGDTGQRTWRCSYYLMCHGIAFKESREKCYHYRCPGRAEDTSVVEDPTEKICSEEGCDNPVASNRREHCSERCRKRMNSRNYLERKRAKVAN